MENISWIVEKEFMINGYSKGVPVQGFQFFSSNKSIDYWLVSYGYFDIINQTELFIEIQKLLSKKYKFIEKNISMLIIVDASEDVKMLSNIVKIENDKAFSKNMSCLFIHQLLKSYDQLLWIRKSNPYQRF